MKTTHEIIDYIAGLYTFETRSMCLKEETCRYNGPNGRKCAFAVCCHPIKESYEGGAAGEVLNIEGPEIVKPEYRGHSAEFWTDIQDLHDCSAYWDESGLSEAGIDAVSALKEAYPNTFMSGATWYFDN